MSSKTKISWCHSTASPWYGCTKASPGCKNCYAEGWAVRAGRDVWGKGKPRQRSKSFDRECRKWNREADENRDRPRIFPSLCDWLDAEVPIEWLTDFLKLIHETPNLDWLLLTKRPENFELRSTEAIGFDLRTERHGLAFNNWLTHWANGTPLDNVWIGVSVEDQKRADERIPELLKIPATFRFLSVEPLLSNVKLMLNKIDWGIVGGESGAHRRDCGVEAICDVAQQCRAAEVPVWVKQDCAFRSEQQGRIPDEIWNLKQLPGHEPL